MKLRSILAGALALALSTSLALAQSGQGSSPLTPAKGGTNSAYVGFTGPTTSVKTYTLPNQSDTIATLAAAAGFTSSLSLTKSQNAYTGIIATNTNAGNASLVGFQAVSDVANAFFNAASSTYAAIPIITGRAYFIGTGANGSAILTTSAAPIVFGINSVEAGRWSGSTPGQLVVGLAGTLAGSVGFQNATSGTITLAPPAGALGTPTLTLPAATDTLVGRATTDTLTNKTLTSPVLTTPSLGAATATSINKVAITAPATSATLTIPDGVTLTGPASSGTAMTLGNTETVTGVKTFGSAGAVGRLKVAGTTSGSTVLDASAVASGTLTLPAATDTLVGKATTDTLTNKTFDTAGAGNSFSINGLAANANTGTGSVVRATSPTMVTPTLGVALATSINGNIFTTGTGTLTFAAGKTLTVSNTLTLTGTDGSSVAFGAGGTVAYTSNNLSAFAATTSAQLAGVLSDETGSGAAVFGTSPTIGGLANFSGARRDSTQSAPAQITANQNDYNPSSVVCATSSTLLINSDAARDVTGIAGGVAGCDLFLFNNGSFSITLKDASASSTAANRFDFGADYVLAAKAAAHLKYDGASSRWRTTTGSGTGGGGGGSVTSVTCNGGATVITSTGTCASHEFLNASRVYYVSTTGNNSNTGLATTTATVTFTNGSANIAWTSHGRSVGDNLFLTTSGALPTNFSTLQLYYVKTVVDANTITVSTSSGGSAVSAGSAGSGTHTVNLVSPFLTIQKAVDTIAANLNIAGNNVTIWAADGTYTAAVVLKNVAGFASAGNLVIQGNNATPANVVVSVTSQTGFSADGISSTWDIKDLKVETVTVGNCISVANGAYVRFGNLNFGAAPSSYHVIANGGAKVIGLSSYAVSGGAFAHLYSVNGSVVSVNAVTATITGTPAFTYWAYAVTLGALSHYSMTFSGSATGTRYSASGNSVIFTNGGGASYLPGNSAGSTASGGQYL